MDFSKYKKTGGNSGSMSTGGMDMSKYKKKSAPIPKTENVLQKAIGIMKEPAQEFVKSFHMGAPMAGYQAASKVQEQLAKSQFPDNPVGQFGFGLATDPSNWAVGGIGLKGAKAATGAVAKGTKSVTRGLKIRSELGKSDRIQNLFQRSAETKRYVRGKEFGKTLNKITNATPARTAEGVSEVVMKYDDDPDVSGVLSKLPSAKNLSRQPLSSMIEGTKSKGIKVGDLQNLINQLEEAFPYKTVGKGKPSSVSGRSLINELRDIQASAFPEIKDARTAFREGAESYKKVSGALSSKTPEKSIMSGFSGKGRQKVAAGKALHGPLNTMMKDARKANKLVNAAKLTGKASLLLGGGKILLDD